MNSLWVLLVWFVFSTMVLKVPLAFLESRTAQHSPCRRVALGNSFGTGAWGLDPEREMPPFGCACPLHFPPHGFSHLTLSCVYVGGEEHGKDGQI